MTTTTTETPTPAYMEHPTNKVIAAVNRGAERFYAGKIFSDLEQLEAALANAHGGVNRDELVYEPGGWRFPSSPEGTVDFQVRPERGTLVTYLDGHVDATRAVTTWVGEVTTVDTREGGRTDEGHDTTYTRYRWCFLQERAEMQVTRDARDCDGAQRYDHDYVACGTRPWQAFPAVLLTDWEPVPRRW